MAKTLKFPLALFLLLALAYIIPPDGVSALKCYLCPPADGSSTSCNNLDVEDCQPDETICHTTELPLGNVIDRCCETISSTKVPGTCSGTGMGSDPKTCYCNTDLCNFNLTTASPSTTTTTATTTTTKEEMCEEESGSTSEHGRTPFLIISFASILFISASFFDNN